MEQLTFTWPADFRLSLEKNYHGRKVLVLGADGFLGSNCIIALAQLGAEVTILSRRKKALMSTYVKHIIYGDLSDIDVAIELVKDQDIIFDFIGTTGAVESNMDAYSNFKIECQPHLNLFKACADFNPSAVIIFCSSRLVYGKPVYFPVDEKHPLSPESLYAVHKLTLENYLRVFQRTHGLKYCTLRLTNPYGLNPNIKLEKNSYSILNYFIRLALNNEAIKIFGDGRQFRDYIHVHDVINAFLARAVTEQCYGQAYNLGGRKKIRIKEAAQIITDCTQTKAVQFIDWPNEYKIVETGDYYSNINKLLSTVDLPEQQHFKDALVATVNSSLKTNNFKSINNVEE